MKESTFTVVLKVREGDDAAGFDGPVDADAIESYLSTFLDAVLVVGVFPGDLTSEGDD